ncbi:DUF4870 domain-containing protein [Paenibacillus taiwanensis]|uniref:DUF4870 domain-containing protein n=1 Tax=Paenibacillus taiwanensis TaxID=401638 RepID=UPI0004112797|nr:DUF4870 domain-containing protein [Paenibacillus taiwanensis]
MKTNNILSSLCYFSIFFAPFLFPIIVWFVAEGDVKAHAKKALWTHFVPYALLITGLIVSAGVGFGIQNVTSLGIGLSITYIVSFLVGIYYFVWNVVKGIRLLNA